MAKRPQGYGFTAEVKRKIASKYDVNQEIEARNWIETIIKETLNGQGEPCSQRFHEELKDGIALCKLMNAIKPGSIKKINESKIAFKQMENISNFLKASQEIGILPSDLFEVADLFENVNMAQVLIAIAAVGRKAQKLGYEGPVFGGRESDSNPRNFSEEKLKAGSAVIGLQMGSNKGASQAGMSFGRARSINEHGQNGHSVNSNNGF